MSVVVGIKAQDGVVLVADAMVLQGTNAVPYQKIDIGLHTEQRRRDDYKSHPHISGAYFAWSGYHDVDFDSGLPIRSFLRNMPNLADRITDEYVLTHDLAQIHARHDELSKKFTPFGHSDPNKSIGDEIQYLDLIVGVRAFIESRGFSKKRFSVLRISDNFAPDLLYVSDGQVQRIELYSTHGSGADLVKPLLDAGCSPAITLEEATNLAISVMNKALERKEEFRGFHLVKARRLDDGTNRVETAFDFDTNLIEPKNINYLGPYFC